jgi:hypothetical protein
MENVNNSKLNFNNFKFSDIAGLKDSIKLIKSATNSSKKNKVNEQELFASFVHEKLSSDKPKIADKFLKIFQNKFDHLKEARENNKILRAVRQSLKKLVHQDKALDQKESLKLRRYAIGMSQLDDNKNLLSTTTNKKDPDNSATMKLDQALTKVQSNSALTPDEHEEFKKVTKQELTGRVNIKYEIDLESIENDSADYTVKAE